MQGLEGLHERSKLGVAEPAGELVVSACDREVMTRVETIMWSKISSSCATMVAACLSSTAASGALVGPAQVQAAAQEPLLVGLLLGQPEIGGLVPEVADAEVLDADHPGGGQPRVVDAAANGLDAGLLAPVLARPLGRCGCSGSVRVARTTRAVQSIS